MPIVILVRAVLMMSALLMMRDVRPTERTTPSQRVSTSLRDDVREIIRPRCGSCHTSTLPTMKQKAVAVFDLAQDNWPNTMSASQLEKFKSRLRSLEDSLKIRVEQFVRDETTRRKARGT